MSTATQQKPGLGVAALFAGVGVAMMIFMAVDQTGLNVPLWVAEAAAASFVFAGVAMAGQVVNWLWLQKLGSIGVVWCLFVPGAWIAFGPDTGSCAGGIGIGMLTAWQEAGNAGCRIAFGFGAVITLLCALAITWHVIGAWRGRAAPEID